MEIIACCGEQSGVAGELGKGIGRNGKTLHLHSVSLEECVKTNVSNIISHKSLGNRNIVR